MANPITKVYLLDVPLESDYKNTLYFANASSQQSYFQSKVIGSYSYNDFTYQRKDNIIRIPEIYDNICHCNYVMYQNTNYSNKWFYAFVTDLEYINDGRTDLHIKTDVIQTWLFDYTLKTSFVEREHTSNDTIGNNLLPEDLELGEYICNSYMKDYNLNDSDTDLCYILGTTHMILPNATPPKEYGGGLYNGIYSGVMYYRFNSVSDIDPIIKAYAEAGANDAITGLFMAPKVLASNLLLSSLLQDSTEPYTYDISVSKTYGLGGYTPNNNKLKTFPYCYLLVDNNNGATVKYNYEYFNSTACVFTVNGVLTPGCSIRMVPKNYKGVTLNEIEGINLGKYPTCAYPVDMYTNWLTQNAMNLSVATERANYKGGMGAAKTGVGTVLAVASGGLLGTGDIMGGIDQMVDASFDIKSIMAEKYQHSLEPPQARGNLNAGDVITASNNNCFHFYNMSISYDFARRIDKYFDMFGYQTNMVKVPNSNHRSKWWYTKTVSCNLDGNVPQNDLLEIKKCYDNGITFWRNASEIENYSLTNGIV